MKYKARLGESEYIIKMFPMVFHVFCSKIFASGMIGLTEISGDAEMLVQIYPFGEKATFCDIGYV